jgi:methionyl aminopeptidase
MQQEVLEKYKKAGMIVAEIKQEVLKIIKPGIKLLDLADLIEDKIRQKAGLPAFPVNISVNEIAAHYTPSVNDTRIINPGDLVKIDIGAHIDGYIGDLAFTYCSESNPLIFGAEKALEAAIKIIKPGVTISEISIAIEQEVKKHGLGLIVNLTGHTLDRYSFHGQPSIPNISNNSNYKFNEGDVIALEPFITQTSGYIKEIGLTEIYRYVQDKPVRLNEARKILELAKNQYHALPFAKRWLYKHFSPVKISLGLKQLENIGAIETYPVLKEVENKPIAQAEHTIIVADKPIVTTRLK